MLPPLPVCIVQPTMRATIADNLPRLAEAIVGAAEQGAALVVFPECATTGFHRDIQRAAHRPALLDAVQTLQRLCDQHGIAAVVGSAWPHEHGMLNAALVLRPGQAMCIAPKVGLTQSERRFFSPAPRALPWMLGGWRLASVLCREVEDIDAVVDAYLGRVDALIWPGYMAWTDDDGPGAVGELAKRLGVPILQCNWPGSLNAPGQHSMGRSHWISAGGDIVELAPDGPGRVFWTLGSS
jgi:omega-amidase